MRKKVVLSALLIVLFTILYAQYTAKPVSYVPTIGAHHEPPPVRDETYYKRSYAGLSPQQWGENVAGVNTHIYGAEEPVLALTLNACGSDNDGIDEKLINFLVEEQIPATLFINGRWLAKFPEHFALLAQNPLFDIQNHGAHHRPASINGKAINDVDGTKNVSELYAEINECADEIEKRTTRRPIFYRSGGAYYDEFAVEIANDMGFTVVGSRIHGGKADICTAAEAESAFLAANSGDIIAAHMNHPEKEVGAGLINALLKLKAKGFRFVLLRDYADKLR